RGRQPLREPSHHRRDRRPPALRWVEGVVGGARRQGRWTELRPAARALATSRAACRRPGASLRVVRDRARPMPGRADGRRRALTARSERGELRAGVAWALQPRAGPERGPWRAEPSSVSALTP